MAFGNVNTGAYQHPRYKECEHDMYRFNVDDTGHIVNAKPITGQDISWLGIEAESFTVKWMEDDDRRDLNEYTEPGFWCCNNADGYQNSPTYGFSFMVVGHGYQELNCVNGIFKRFKDLSTETWGEWFIVYTENNPQSTTADTITAGQDLNNVDRPGLYICSPDPSVHNTVRMNPANAGFLMIVNGDRNSQGMQTLTATYRNSSEVAHRVYRRFWLTAAGKTTWTEWVMINDGSDVSEAPQPLEQEFFDLTEIDSSIVGSIQALRTGEVVTITMNLSLPNVGEPGNFKLAKLPVNYDPQYDHRTYVPLDDGYGSQGRGVITVYANAAASSKRYWIYLDAYLYVPGENVSVTISYVRN